MTTPADRPLPEQLRRARDYAAIFIKAGDRWRNFVPVDAQVAGDHVTIDGVLLWREAGTWRMTMAGAGTWVITEDPE